jgi:hypothetical protein
LNVGPSHVTESDVDEVDDPFLPGDTIDQIGRPRPRNERNRECPWQVAFTGD